MLFGAGRCNILQKSGNSVRVIDSLMPVQVFALLFNVDIGKMLP